MGKNLRRLLALVAALALMLAACSASNDDSDGESAESTSATVAAREAGTDGGDGGGDDASSAGDEALDAAFPGDDGVAAEAAQLAAQPTEGEEGVDPLTPPDIQTFTFGRDIIFSADMVLATDDVGGTAERAAVAVEGLGGIVFGQNSQTTPEPRATVTFKVPPARFQETLRRLADLGDVQSQTVSAEDVTDAVVDLESRIQTAEASVERLRGFLAGATDLDQISRLEAQLLERETVLEQLRGQVRTLEDRVALATIVLTVTQALPPELEPGFDVAVSAYAGHDAGGGCPSSPNLAIDEGDPMTVCWAVTNTGDAHLGEIVVGANQLGVDLTEITVVAGSLERPTAPGDTLVLAWEVEADADHVLDSTVRAVPVDEDGNRLGLGARRQTATAELDVAPDDSLPGFTDALKRSGELLAFVGQILIVVAGALLPFVPFIAAGAALTWWLRRRDNPAT
ncbi:MAG: DUF4349 domain-containing protein [Acidimicrobiia bacterium]|nr:DUF4349 domain-containing protein [Acidimicrobiia bacterium]